MFASTNNYLHWFHTKSKIKNFTRESNQITLRTVQQRSTPVSAATKTEFPRKIYPRFADHVFSFVACALVDEKSFTTDFMIFS